uniref:Uncharacterized protein n=1 Tax=Caenorhabditis japonica TaxID=281687 RepID=A0A8R1EGA5_CAEJA
MTAIAVKDLLGKLGDARVSLIFQRVSMYVKRDIVMSGLAQAYILPRTHVTSPPCLAYQSIFLDHPASLWPPRTSRRRPRTSCVSLVNAHVSPPVAHHLDSLAFPSLAWSGLRAPIIHTFAPNHDAGNRP